MARFYDELAVWWPLFSPPIHYVEEAADLLPRLRQHLHKGSVATLLELGSGGGSLASHFKAHFRMTLTDRSSGMLAVNAAMNPESEHVLGDMRTLRLGRRFDVVFIHDAIMYATTADDVQATLRTAALHCRPGGRVVVVPDYVRETFAPVTDHGGEDGADGRALRYLQWVWDPDPSDCTYVADFAFLLRQPDGQVSAVHDRHVEGLFSRHEWQEFFAGAGLDATSTLDPWNRDLFLATPEGV
jgi:trans-aconitate methyltransferase